MTRLDVSRRVPKVQMWNYQRTLRFSWVSVQDVSLARCTIFQGDLRGRFVKNWMKVSEGNIKWCRNLAMKRGDSVAAIPLRCVYGNKRDFCFTRQMISLKRGDNTVARIRRRKKRLLLNTRRFIAALYLRLRMYEFQVIDVERRKLSALFAHALVCARTYPYYRAEGHSRGPWNFSRYACKISKRSYLRSHLLCDRLILLRTPIAKIDRIDSRGFASSAFAINSRVPDYGRFKRVYLGHSSKQGYASRLRIYVRARARREETSNDVKFDLPPVRVF